MKVTVVQAGGLAGLVTTTTADTADLGAGEADALHDHVARVGLLAPDPPVPPRSAPQPDRYDQEITVEHDGSVSRMRVADGDAPPEVRDLVRFVRTTPGATRRVDPPG